MLRHGGEDIFSRINRRYKHASVGFEVGEKHGFEITPTYIHTVDLFQFPSTKSIDKSEDIVEAAYRFVLRPGIEPRTTWLENIPFIIHTWL